MHKMAEKPCCGHEEERRFLPLSEEKGKIAQGPDGVLKP
jgi:hypothetical protein